MSERVLRYLAKPVAAALYAVAIWMFDFARKLDRWRYGVRWRDAG